MAYRDSKLRAYLELLRLPNVFTAMADVLMGGIFVTAPVWPASSQLRPGVLALLVASSSCLYLAGMVLNDYFDRAKDAAERPARPIPSRRVQESTARWLGSELLILGVALAWLASFFVGSPRSGLIAIALAVAIVLYDGVLKSSVLGPVAMGACRGLNVLLGMSVVDSSWQSAHYVVAGGLMLYVIGVTWFARNEATLSHRAGLAASTLVILAGLAVLAYFPNVMGLNSTRVGSQIDVWYLLWAVLGAQIGWRCLRAAFDPVPANVQRAVKNCILSLIVLDAAVVLAVHPSWYWSIGILALLLPAMFLGRWIYST